MKKQSTNVLEYPLYFRDNSNLLLYLYLDTGYAVKGRSKKKKKSGQNESSQNDESIWITDFVTNTGGKLGFLNSVEQKSDCSHVILFEIF